MGKLPRQVFQVQQHINVMGRSKILCWLDESNS